MNREQVTRALAEFVVAPELQVAALSGSWGVGKTWLWSDFARKFTLPETVHGVAYASLFGATSLDELRLRVAMGLLRRPRSYREIAARWGNAVKRGLTWLFVRPFQRSRISAVPTGWLARAQRYANGNAWALIGDASYWFVRDSLVALDDLERCPALDLVTVLGFVEELRSRGCKVVLITNREKLDSSTRRTLWEKVVDRDLRLSPDPDDNSRIVFGESYEPAGRAAHIRATLNALGCDNIRIHKRTAWLLRIIGSDLAELSNDVQKQVVVNAATLSWVLLEPDQRVPLEAVLEPEHSRMWAQLADEDKVSEEERRWQSLVEATGFEPMEFNQHLVSLICTGSCDSTAFQAAMQSFDREADMARARDRLQDTYRVYTSSFNTTRDEYIRLVQTVLREEVDRLYVHWFADALSQLQSFGEDTSDLVQLYIAHNREHLDRVAGARDRQPISDKLLSDEVARREAEQLADGFTIDSVASHLALGGDSSGNQIRYLGERSVDEYELWIRDGPPKLGDKLKALLRFRESAAEPKYRCIGAAVEDALRRVARRSEFNRERIERVYGIDLAESGGDPQGT